MCVCMSVCMYVCMYVYTYVYIYDTRNAAALLCLSRGTQQLKHVLQQLKYVLQQLKHVFLSVPPRWLARARSLSLNPLLLKVLN